jgi:hypothetical protein
MLLKGFERRVIAWFTHPGEHADPLPKIDFFPAGGGMESAIISR